MASYQELEAELARVRGLLIERDRAEAAARADALAKQQATEAAADLAAQAEARAKEVATIRKGAWLSHLIGQQTDKAATLDLAALASQIPADGSWPPGTDESIFNIGAGAVKQTASVESTFLGKLRGVRSMAENVNVSDVESAEKAKILNALRAERKTRQSAERELKELKSSASLAAPTADALAAHVESLVTAEVAKRGSDAVTRAAALEKELTTTKAKLSDLTIKTAVREAARAQHMTPEGIEHAITLGLASLACDDKGEPRTKDGSDVAGFIDGLKASASFLWPLSRGTGSRGSGEAMPPELGSNPFTREGFNLTAQSRIARESPERARQLQAQAAAMALPGRSTN